ncbi:MAG: hypothetical protein JOZ33_09515 [Acidobacteriaceae bacterium]|nr:hypothetical protein [Acidobacteriaceae bacterium]
MSMPMNMSGRAASFLESIEMHATSGTSAEPDSTPIPMMMAMHDDWMLMFHGVAFVADVQQSSPRGQDKVFSTNWFMPMAQHPLGHGQLTLRTMLSLEPATVTDRQYPLLFQQGETAYGKPIVDGQHPHDFLMELAALYDWHAGERTLLSLYVAPVGDPALGPTAYPHRASAAENPVATLGHHQEDSTHIAEDVITIGFTHRIFRIEASGFHGREPDEHRWQVQQGPLDSWSSRLTVQPSQNWTGQCSYGRLHSPEQLNPGEDQERMTASLMYNRPLGGGTKGNWASTLAWGRTRAIPTNLIQNSYVLESTLRFAVKNYVWTRFENVDRTTELLLGEQSEPPGFVEELAARVQAYTFGYDRDFDLLSRLRTALGAQVMAYTPGSRLKPVYGSDPMGVVVYLRLRAVGRGQR